MGAASPRAGPGPGRETAPASPIHRTGRPRPLELRFRTGDAEPSPRRQEPAIEPRPPADVLRRLVLDDLARTFTVEDEDDCGFSLRRAGRVVRVRISAPDLESCLGRMEESAHRALGVEPPWRSAVSLAAVHILAETAMADEGMTVVLDDSVVRRDPPPA
jgi:hypothetical protein